MRTIKLTCHNCGSNLEINDKIAFCPYCGTKLLIDDEHKKTTYTYVHRDEASIRENERKEKVRLRELENEENQKKRDQRQLYLGFGMMVFVLLFIFVMIIYNDNVGKPKADEIKMPCSMSDYKGEHYEDVLKELENLGFYKIETAEKKDLVTGWVTKDGSVYKVSINGDSDFEEYDIFPKDAEVVVTYHTFKN